MVWQTHAVAGANTAWIAYALGAGIELVILMAVLGAFVALFPDIDGDHAKIHNIGVGGITPFAIFRGGFKHRGFFHSLLAVVILVLLLTLFVPEFTLLFALCLGAAYASHLILDGFTPSGIKLLFPKKTKYHFLPKPLQLRTGRTADFLLLFLGSLALAGLFWLILPELQNLSVLPSLL